MLSSVLTSLDLRSAIVRDPLVVSPNTAVIDAIAQMHSARIATPPSHCRARSSCVLVVDNHQVVGILTRQDVIRLSAQQQPLAQAMRRIMTQPVVTLHESASGRTALDLLEQHQIHYLPVLNEHNGLVGLVTRDRLLQSLHALERDQPIEALKQEIPNLETEHRSTIEERTAVLQIQEQFLQIVLDTLPLSIFWKDRHSVFVGCNRQFLSDAGLTSMTDIQGKTDYDLPWSRTEADAYRANDQAVMETNIAKIGIIETQLRADGRQVWIEVNKLLLHNLKGATVYFIVPHPLSI
jgi:CBS domain-containing protein